MVAAGLAKPEVADHNDEHNDNDNADIEPCDEETAARLAPLVDLLGEKEALRLLQREAEAPYGCARRCAAIRGAAKRRLDRLPRKKAREWREKGWSLDGWAFSRARDLAAALEDAIDALQTGAFRAWQEETKRARARVRPPEPPPIRFDHGYESEAGDLVSRYEEELSQWAENFSDRELRAAGVNLWELIRVYRERVNAARAEYAKRQYDRALARALEIYEKEGGDPSDACERAAAEIPSPFGGWGSDVERLRELSPRAWREGWPYGTEPPIPMTELKDAEILRVLELVFSLRGTSRFHKETWQLYMEEWIRRVLERHPDWGGVVWEGFCYRRDRDEWTHLRDALLYAKSENNGPGGPANPKPWRTAPHPEGWVELRRGAEPFWCGPEEWGVLQIAHAAEGGGLWMRPLAHAYRRHPERGYAMADVTAYRGGGIRISYDDRLHRAVRAAHKVASNGPVRNLIVDGHEPDRIVRIPGRPIVKGRTHLHIRYDEQWRGALVVVQDVITSRGRWGWSGTLPVPHERNEATVLHVVDGSRGGGQRGCAIVAILEEGGPPFLLGDGSGYRLGEDGVPERVKDLDLELGL